MSGKDFFLCHATPDKDQVVLPLANALEARGHSCWVDQAEIDWGQSIVRSIQDGLNKSHYVIVIISDAFLDPKRTWTAYELEAALTLEIAGRSRVLPLIVGDEEAAFEVYPFLRPKRFIRWDAGLDAIIEQVEKLRAKEQRPYVDAIRRIANLPVDDEIQISEIAYGMGPNAQAFENLLRLPNDTAPPQRFVPLDGRQAYIIRELLPADWERAYADRALYVPYTYTVSGVRAHASHTIALYRLNDQVYLVGHDRPNGGRTFSITASQGRGGISPFITHDGSLQNNNPYGVGGGLGAVRLLTAVAFKDGVPVARSPYVLCIRKGILYPDDIWRSTLTGTAIVPPGTTDFSKSRFLFQSHQPNGMSSDLYAADFNGGHLCNLTRKDETRYDGLFDDDGREVGRWLDRDTIEYCGMHNGGRTMKITKDCITGRLPTD